MASYKTQLHYVWLNVENCIFFEFRVISVHEIGKRELYFDPTQYILVHDTCIVIALSM